MLIHTWSAWSLNHCVLRNDYSAGAFCEARISRIFFKLQLAKSAIIYSAASKERTSEFSRKTLLFLYGPIAMLFQLFGTYYILIYFNYAKSISNTQTLCVTFHIRLQRVSHTVTVNIHLVCNVGPNLSPQFELC